MRSQLAVAALAAGFLCIGARGQAQTPKDEALRKIVERGKMLVTIGGCNDCHSPKVFTPKGPEPDQSRLLSGAPSDAKIPNLPDGVLGPDKWGAVCSNDFTAWAGPWGISFTRNLTPDVATGLGSWTEAMFIKALRTGKDMGEGRDILPPMPWQNFGQMPDDDLKAVFAYLKSLKPVKNAVHDPIPPAGAPAPAK
jgi:mono/diheme cytochrome c family protein